jgi:hypothetical protein
VRCYATLNEAHGQSVACGVCRAVYPSIADIRILVSNANELGAFPSLLSERRAEIKSRLEMLGVTGGHTLSIDKKRIPDRIELSETTNTVRECLFFGVPMVLFPLAFDNPGCAARVRYHGLGVSGDLKHATPHTILHLVSTVLEDPAYKRRAEEMQDRCREMQEQALAARVIASMVEKNLSREPA